MAGSNLLLLHGALGGSDQFAPPWLPLADHYKLHLVDFEGHGRAPGRGRPFRIEHFVQNAVEYLDAHGIGSTSIFGYIMVGDRDSTVSTAECVEVYRALPQGELDVLPGTPHPLERVSHDRLARSLIECFRNP